MFHNTDILKGHSKLDKRMETKEEIFHKMPIYFKMLKKPHKYG